MTAAQRVVGLGRSARTKARLKTRQPLAEAVVVLPSDWSESDVDGLRDLIAAELNVKTVTIQEAVEKLGRVTLKPNFPVLGKRLGAKMKALAKAVQEIDAADADNYRRTQSLKLSVDGGAVALGGGELLVDIDPAPGYHAESDGRLIVGIDTRLTEELQAEGYARELINRVQNTRKGMGLEVTDRIRLEVTTDQDVVKAVELHAERIKTETLAVDLATAVTDESTEGAETIDLNGHPATIRIEPHQQ
jgi:isoleucyl-tRNA synthetase